MKIQHLIHTPRYSGAEILVASLTLAHKKLGHFSNVTSFAPAEPDFEKIIKEQRENGIEWNTPSAALKGTSRIAHYYRAEKAFKPDIIFAHSVIPAAYARAGLLDKIISVLHAEDNYPGGTLAAAEYLLQFRSKGIIHISPLAGSLYSQKYKSPPIQCIPNGINLAAVNEASSERNNSRAQFGFCERARIFIQAGRICRIKGQHHSLLAIAPILRLNPDAHFLLAGLIEDHHYQKELEEICRLEGIEGKVIFLGPRDDIPALLHASDIFVMPSKQEAQGIALVEALAAGLPIVASDINGFQFARDFDGVRLVDTTNKSDFLTAINELSTTPLRYSRNLTKYDIQDTASAYIEFAKKCIY